MTPENMHQSAETKIKRLTEEIEEIDEIDEVFFKRNGPPLYTPTCANESGMTPYDLLFPAKCPSRFRRVFETSTLMSFGLRNNIQLLNRIAGIAVLKGSPR